MGSNSAHAQGIVLFLVAFVLVGGGFASGGKIVYFLVAIVMVVLSALRFRAARRLEHGQSENIKASGTAGQR